MTTSIVSERVSGSRPVSPAARWRPTARVAAATTLFVTGAFWLAADLLGTKLDGAAGLSWIARHPGRAGLELTFDMLTVPFLFGTVVVWLLLSRGRSPRLAWTGAVLLAFGVAGQGAIGGAELIMYTVARSGRLDLTTFAEVTENAAGVPGMVLTVTFMVGAFIGLVVAMIAAWRSGTLPRAAVVLLVASQVLDLVEVPFLALVLTFAGLTWMAVAIVRSGRATATPAATASSPVAEMT